MVDFVVVNLVENLGGGVVAYRVEDCGILAGVIEIGLLEGKGEACDVVQWVFHGGDAFPEVIVEGQFAELDAALLHAVHVELGMDLLVLEGFEEAASKAGGRVGEFEKREGHEFRGEELMVAEEM